MALDGSNKGELSDYERNIKFLSDAIVRAQSPIRILDAIKWDASIREAFFAKNFKEQPPVTKEHYLKNLNIDWQATREKFQIIKREITKRLGQFNVVGQMMRQICSEYLIVLYMLEMRGTPEFSLLSQDLYGSAKDVFHVGDPTLAQLGVMMADAIAQVDQSKLLPEEPRNIDAQTAIAILQQALDKEFQQTGVVRVMLNDGIIADAAAGGDYIKIRSDAKFNFRDLKLLEIHEGLVHIGTNLNGKSQPLCTFLSKGPPSCTMTQEGLAILMELLSLISYPARLKKLGNRIRAVELAEDGATFLDIFEFYRTEGYDEDSCYLQSMRVFRGSLPQLGPFTKDLSYCKGFVTVFSFIQLAVRKGKLDRIPLLFCGKTNIENIREIYQLVEEGIIIPPKFLPPQIKDLNAITAWACFASFFNQLSLGKIESDYSNLLGD